MKPRLGLMVQAQQYGVGNLIMETNTMTMVNLLRKDGWSASKHWELEFFIQEIKGIMSICPSISVYCIPREVNRVVNFLDKVPSTLPLEIFVTVQST